MFVGVCVCGAATHSMLGRETMLVVGTPIVQLPEQLRTPEAVPSKLAICLPYIVLMLICLLR